MNEKPKGSEKWPWADNHYPDVCLEVLVKAMKTSNVRIVSSPADVRTEYLPRVGYLQRCLNNWGHACRVSVTDDERMVWVSMWEKASVGKACWRDWRKPRYSDNRFEQETSRIQMKSVPVPLLFSVISKYFIHFPFLQGCGVDTQNTDSDSFIACASNSHSDS
jgi:hypothetical protein